MIGSIRGQVIESNVESCIVETSNGVGYLIYITPDTASEIFTSEKEVLFYTYTVVREDTLDLYGFKNLDEKSLFEQVIGVSGVGPKSGLAILSVGPINQLKSAIAAGDIDYLTKVSGIGKKSAQKIILELQDKVSQEVLTGSVSSHSYTTDNEVLAALLALGYNEREARGAIKEIDSEISGTEKRLKAVLKILS